MLEYCTGTLILLPPNLKKDVISSTNPPIFFHSSNFQLPSRAKLASFQGLPPSQVPEPTSAPLTPGGASTQVVPAVVPAVPAPSTPPQWKHLGVGIHHHQTHRCVPSLVGSVSQFCDICLREDVFFFVFLLLSYRFFLERFVFKSSFWRVFKFFQR